MATPHAGTRQLRLGDPDSRVLARRLGVRRPTPVVVLSGTTADLPNQLGRRVLPMLEHAVVVAADRGAAIVTGGTDAGVFHLLGIALSSAPRRPRVVIGVAPDDLVAAESSPEDPGDRPAVARGHTVILRVPGADWGDETPALSHAVTSVSAGAPVAVVLVGGGEGSRRELIEHLIAGRPVIAIAGSGRLADAVSDGSAAGERDDDLGVLLASGDVRIVGLDDGPQSLGYELEAILARAPRPALHNRIALLSGAPRLRVPPDGHGPPVAADAARRYPHLRRQLAEAATVVVPALDACDRQALVHQNRHRWFTVLAIVGGMLTTVFGALQAWLQSAPWPGVVVVTLGAATSALVVVARRQGSLHQYLVARVRAERLRSLYFEYVAEPPPADDATRARRLRELERQVVNIRTEPVIG
jgi:SLOG in TRPM, prokaryote/Protein of unknown function (DUF4231)